MRCAAAPASCDTEEKRWLPGWEPERRRRPRLTATPLSGRGPLAGRSSIVGVAAAVGMLRQPCMDHGKWPHSRKRLPVCGPEPDNRKPGEDALMNGNRILLGVTGGIAAYKSPELVRRLRERGAQVQVVMTAGAQKFITALSLQAVSGRAVRTDLWDSTAEAAMGHIELARWAELVLVAPASADFLARPAHGLADDLLSTP